MRCRPACFLSSLPLLEWEEISPNLSFSAFRGLNLATDILLEEKLLVLMVLVLVLMVVVMVVVGGAEGLTCLWPGLTLTFCLLLGGDVSPSIWLGPVMSAGCIFPISCKSPLSFTHFLPFNLSTHPSLRAQHWSGDQKLFLELCKAGFVIDGSSKVIVSQERGGDRRGLISSR